MMLRALPLSWRDVSGQPGVVRTSRYCGTAVMPIAERRSSPSDVRSAPLNSGVASGMTYSNCIIKNI